MGRKISKQIKMIMSRGGKLFKICAASSMCISFLIMLKYRSRDDVSFTADTFKKTVIINYLIKSQRRKIVQEMANFEYSSARFGNDAENLTDLIPETGGTPIRSVIISTWRSGSTFLGDILNAMPGNYYHFEPFQHLGEIQVRGGLLAKKAIANVKNLLKCDYSDMNEYLEYGKKYHRLYSLNHRLWKQCKEYPEFCSESKFLTPFCKIFPLQSLKVARLRLALAEQLLDDTSLNVRILLLVRDPRGTMQSRNLCQWCHGYPDCDDASYLCKDLVSDYYAAEILYKKYPTRFKVVRYEDLSVSPYDMTQDIFKFYGLPFHYMVKEFLDTHTSINRGGEHTTFRDSKSAPFHWITDLPWNKIKEIQNSCANAMEFWGYRKMNSSKEHNQTFDPVMPASFI